MSCRCHSYKNALLGIQKFVWNPKTRNFDKEWSRCVSSATATRVWPH